MSARSAESFSNGAPTMMDAPTRRKVYMLRQSQFDAWPQIVYEYRNCEFRSCRLAGARSVQ
jgi:hypothetical protein